jgi:hypothetical protein
MNLVHFKLSHRLITPKLEKNTLRIYNDAFRKQYINRLFPVCL